MNDKITFNPLRYRKRWFAYFDLLGFSNLVHNRSIQEVLPIYSEALNQMHLSCKLGKKESGLLNSWFSDTFIIYTSSDSTQDFDYLENAARIFFQLLILSKIPVRGCISHGELYSQSRKNIFIGPALIEAHAYGEALNWLGLCFAPSIEKRLLLERPSSCWDYYRKVWDRRVLRKVAEEYLYSFEFNDLENDGKSQYLAALELMKNAVPVSVHDKYENTNDFILGNI
jgi:hypothetical protein